jgi:ketosteroid isomerase-like protein
MNDDGKIQVLNALRSYHDAMIRADTDDLANMLDAHHSLVHITGYVQPKHEWLDAIRTGEFNYHAIDLDEKSLSVKVAGSAAEVTGGGIFNATISGMKHSWRLRFTVMLEHRGGRWIIMTARYTTF